MKILLNISSDLYVRNYIQSGVLSELKKQHELYVIASSAVSLQNDVEGAGIFKGYYTFDKKLSAKHFNLLHVCMWRWRHLSKAFRFRIKRFNGHHIFYGNKTAWDWLKVGPRLIRHHLISEKGWTLLAPLLSSAYFYNLFFERYSKSLPICEDLIKCVASVNPDLIIHFSSAFDPVGIDLVRITENTKAKSLFIVDNWDNLCSKSIMWKRPDHMAVWGHQSKVYAREIQGMSDENVSLIGTARFDQYFQLRDKQIPSHFEYPYVLFSGCALPFDELPPLRILENEIENNKDLYGNLKIIYRPHPWRQKRRCHDRFNSSEFKHITIDPQVTEQYYNYKHTKFQPSLDYYPSLLANARFVVSTPTTLLVEAAIFRKRILAIVIDDGWHLTNPSNTYKHYQHFKAINRFKSISRVNNITSLAASFREAFCASPTIDAVQNDKALSYILHFDKQTYADRLVTIADKVMNKEKEIS